MAGLLQKQPNAETVRNLPCGERRILQEKGKPVTYEWRGRLQQAWRCSDCGYVFFDTPAPQVLTDYYQGEYAANAASWYTAANDFEPDRTMSRAQVAIKEALRYFDNKHVTYHEYGCAFGGTVARLNDMGFDATGTDLSADAIAQGRQRGCDRLFAEYEKDFFERENRIIDVMFSFHAMEHMLDPVQFLIDVRPALRGVMIVRVPNSLSYLAIKEGFRSNSWFAYPDHLHMLSPRALLCLAERAGYAVLDINSGAAAPSPEQSAALLAKYAMKIEDIEEALLGLELGFTLTPKNSNVAQRFGDQIEQVAARCQKAGVDERVILDTCARG